jgi:hypothetical protein
VAETFNSVISRVQSSLLGLTQDQEQYGTLALAMGATDTTFTVDTATADNLGRGTIEIDDELILVQQVDRPSGTVTVQAGVNGRGWRSTTAASHSQTALITMAPTFPRTRIKEAVNDTILAMYPNLVVFESVEITKLAPVFEYVLPADVDDVWYVVGQLVGPTKIWQPLPNWRYNPMANLVDFPTGKSLELFDFVTPGRLMRVVYAHEPTPLVADSDLFSTTGFTDRVVDIVVYGVMSRLLPTYEAARLQQRSIESSNRSALVPPQSATRTAQYYQALYMDRLAQERAQMMSEIPNYATFQGS